MIWVEVDENLINDIENITSTDYEIKDGKITIDSLLGIVEDLKIELENRDEKIQELESPSLEDYEDPRYEYGY